MPTMDNLSEVQRECRTRGRTKLHEWVSTMNRNENSVEEGVDPRGESRGYGITPLGRSHQVGGEGGVVDPTMISLMLRFG